jgi:hypothetical protein
MEACSSIKNLRLQTDFGEVKGVFKDFRNYSGRLQGSTDGIEDLTE